MNIETAPVALVIFNRPRLTAQVFERVRAARPRRLLVVADGPRPNRPEEVQLCEAARKLVTTPDWPCELLTNFAEENMGCRRRLSSGLDWVFKECSEAMILEDDCVPCPSFFTFCSSLLEHYRDDERIMHISGDNWQDGNRRGTGSYYFSRYSLSWGWASWRRAWRHYDVNMSLWPEALKEGWLSQILENPVEVHYWKNIYEKLHRGEIDTWDYQWLLACWRRGALSIHPNENLVTNIGAGPDALHFKCDDHSTLFIPTGEIEECIHPPQVVRDPAADRHIFRKHIAEKRSVALRNWFRRKRKSLSLRTRLKGLLQHSRS